MSMPSRSTVASSAAEAFQAITTFEFASNAFVVQPAHFIGGVGDLRLPIAGLRLTKPRPHGIDRPAASPSRSPSLGCWEDSRIPRRTPLTITRSRRISEHVRGSIDRLVETLLDRSQTGGLPVTYVRTALAGRGS